MKITTIETAIDGQIWLSTKLKKYVENNSKNVTFCFGDWQVKLELNFKEELREHEIAIPKKCHEQYTIPNFPYELVITESVIMLGPVICFVPVRKRRHLIRDIEAYRSYFENSSHINGLIFVCAVEDIVMKNNFIHGFFYDFSIGKWKEGTFPLPNVLFRRTYLPQQKYDFLKMKFGDKLFNSPIYDKWEMWKLLSTNQMILKHLPDSKLLTKGSLRSMVNKYSEVHLKPINGSYAIGVYKITRDGSQFFLRNTKGNSKVLVEKKLDHFVSKKTNYLVQQTINCDDKEKRNIVIRAILQKNGQKEWQCSGTYGRIGKQDSIATNRLLTDEFSTVRELFEKYYELTKEAAEKKEQEMINLCITACQVLEKRGSYADIAIDLMMDLNKKLWIIEINHRSHNHLSPLQTINDRDMYNTVVRTPFEYAKSLAGFFDNAI